MHPLDLIMIIFVTQQLQDFIKYLYLKVVLEKQIHMIVMYFKQIDKEENLKLNNNFRRLVGN